MNETATTRGLASRVKINVTAETIAQACKADSRHCMIAQSIATQFPNVRNISVDMMNIRWSDPSTGWRYIYMTPKPAQYALLDFDMGLPVKPFSFQVRSGLATPMIIGTGKNRKRAHKVRESSIAKITDKTIVHGIGRDTVPMCVKGEGGPVESKSGSTPSGSSKGLPAGIGVRSRGLPTGSGLRREWHPSHHSIRRFGMRGFTEGYTKITN